MASVPMKEENRHRCRQGRPKTKDKDKDTECDLEMTGSYEASCCHQHQSFSPGSLHPDCQGHVMILPHFSCGCSIPPAQCLFKSSHFSQGSHSIPPVLTSETMRSGFFLQPSTCVHARYLALPSLPWCPQFQAFSRNVTELFYQFLNSGYLATVSSPLLFPPLFLISFYKQIHSLLKSSQTINTVPKQQPVSSASLQISLQSCSSPFLL